MSLIADKAVSSKYGVIDYSRPQGTTIGRDLFVAAMINMQRGTIGHKLLVSVWIALTLLLIGATSWFAVDRAQAQAVDIDIDQLASELENTEHNDVDWFLVDSRFTSDAQRCDNGIGCNDIVVVETIVSNPGNSPKVIDIGDINLVVDSGSEVEADFFDCGNSARQFVSDSQQVVLDCIDRTPRFQLQANESIPIAMLFELTGQAEYGPNNILSIRESHRRAVEASILELG